MVSLRGTQILHRSLQRSWLPLVSDQWVGLRVGSCLLFRLAQEDTDLLSLGQIHAGHDVLGCWCKHEFSDSNALTASTDVLLEELHWPPCTCWRLGWCRMLQVPVLLQHYGCYPVGVGRYLMLCHTQYIRSLAWIGQWPCTASGECLCPRPTSSVRPIGWGWGPPCTQSSVPWCASWRRGANPTKARGTPPLAEVCYQS